MRKSLILLTLAFGFYWLNAQINQFPHIEDFELEYQGPINCGGQQPIVNGTWKNVSTDDNDWYSDKNGTPSGNTGPTADHTYGNANGHYMFVETSCLNTGFPNKRSDLVSSYYSFTNVSWPLRLEFWYHMRGNWMGLLHLDVDTTQGQSWINDIVQPWTDNQNLWKKKLVDLAPYIGKDSVRFRLRYYSGSEYAGDVAVDDIKVYSPVSRDIGISNIVSPLSGCGSNGGLVTVELENTGLNSFFPGDTLPVLYQLGGGNAVTENFVLTAQFNPGSQLNLTFSTPISLPGPGNYAISARTLLASDGYPDNDQRSRTFENYAVVTAPWFQDFENGDGGFFSGGANSTWSFGEPHKNQIVGAASGEKCWVNGYLGGSYPLNEDSYLESPCIDISGLCLPKISMQLWWEIENSWDGANLQVTTDDGITWNTVGAFGDADNWYNDNLINSRPGGANPGWTGTVADSNGSGGWVDARNFLPRGAGVDNIRLRLAFGSDYSVNSDGIALDDLMIYDGVYLGPDIAWCGPGSVVLTADSNAANDQYLWSTGATSRSISITTPGTYWVQYQNPTFGCASSDTIEVIDVGSPGYSVNIGTDSTVCGGMMLNAGTHPQSHFLWSNGDSAQSIMVTNSGAYFVDLITPCGTVRSNTVNITVEPAPLISLGNDTTVCGHLVLDAGVSGATYLWNTGDTTSSLSANATGNYYVDVTAGNGCISTDSIFVEVNPLPEVNLGPDTLLCAGDTLCLDGGVSAGNNYQWSNGATTQTLCVANPGVYSVENTDPLGCFNRDTIEVTFSAPVAVIDLDTNSCPIIFFFDASYGGSVTSWLWDFGDGNTSTLQNPVHDYSQAGQGGYFVTLTTTNRCGTSDTSAVLAISCYIGMEEAVSGDLKVFPNPNSGRFEIEWEGMPAKAGRLLVTDLLGRIVWDDQRENWPVSGNLPVDLGLQPEGLYVVYFQVGDVRWTRKVEVLK